MGIDIYIHDYYIVVGHIPLALGIIVLTIAIIFGAWKLAKFFWLMLAG